ncbi:hypothetical protein KOW79_005100 [Hemibagrus wyckioides]|uniref:RRM domain-containing protein n=1 Tax=Hemibagrus wyckioides TaxID=337641 RepID=A0A9D3SNB3_9TELE|nr:hypothetical protein KOW79_005100 [Hemibagrus wyckioides]
MWPVIPFEQHLYLAVNDVAGYWDRCLSILVEDERKFLLNKSVYDLVKVNYFLELTDPKLLSWYLSISPEDRKLIQEEGGLLKFLQRHPALEVSRHIIHLKQQVIRNCFPVPAPDMSSKPDGSRQAYGVSRCVNCGTSCPSGAEKCRRCSMLILNAEENVRVHEEEKTLQLLPNNVRAELNLYKGHVSEDMAMRSSQQFDKPQSISNSMLAPQSQLLNSFHQPEQPQNNSSDRQLLCQMWEERVHCDGKAFQVFKDQSAQASFLLDRELEMQAHSQSNDHDEVPLQPDSSSDFPNLQEETLSGYYSLNSTTVEHTSAQWSDVTNTSIVATKGSTEASANYEPVTSGTHNFPDSVSFLSQSSEWTDLSEDCQNLSSEDDLECETKADEYHSVNEEESSSLATCPPCVNPSWSESGQSTQESEFTHEGCISSTSLGEPNVKTTKTCKVSAVSLSVSQAVDASSDFRACFTSTQATEITQDFFVKHYQDVSTGTDLCPVNQETQTIQRPTSEKCTITEVYMSDLDALCEEFGKLKMMEELMCLKDKMPSAGGLRSKQQKSCGCGAVPRARWAELRLLALQFAMCQQHCWRRFYTSQEGETSLQGIEAVPDAMSQTLKSLEDSYLKMKRKILEGIPLDNLKPLSVDTKRLTAATCYSPCLIYEAFLSDHLPESSFKASSLKDEGQTNQAEVLKIIATDHGHVNKNTKALGRDSATLTETVNSKKSKLVPGSSKPPGVSSDAKHGAPKDLNSSDSWFDAEEELGYAGCSCKEDRQPELRDHGNSKKEQNELDQCFLLCVSNLPNTVTEGDLLLWFGNYHTDQVSISNFAHTRVAVVSVRNPDDAEAAVREMNGQSIQGHTLHVEHIHKPPTDGQVTIKESCGQLVDCAPTAHKAGSVGKWLIPQSSNSNFRASRLFRCSLDKLTNICAIPTASGTCVPQHYGTMGSFDTIMAKLTERHPKIGRQQIVTALLELQAKRHGVLSGLPLRDIIDMTSELLTHSATD